MRKSHDMFASPFRGILDSQYAFLVHIFTFYCLFHEFQYSFIAPRFFFGGGWKKIPPVKFVPLLRNGYFFVRGLFFAAANGQDNLCWAAALSALDHCGRWQEALDLLLRMLGAVEPLKKRET